MPAITTSVWFRLCVDVDRAGNAVGASYEVHDGESRTAIHVLIDPGPFDSIADIISQVAGEARNRYGVQPQLF